MYKLDYSKAATLQISNDAFFYIYLGEDPLDDSNLEEADEVLGMFPNGFEIDDSWKTVENSDLIEATFIPYIKDASEYDMYYEMAKGYFWQIKFVHDNRAVKLWTYRDSTGERIYKGEFTLKRSPHKNALINFSTGDWRSGKGCLVWLKDYIQVNDGHIEIPGDIPIGT